MCYICISEYDYVIRDNFSVLDCYEIWIMSLYKNWEKFRNMKKKCEMEDLVYVVYLCYCRIL